MTQEEIKLEMIKEIGTYNNSLVESIADSCSKVVYKQLSDLQAENEKLKRWKLEAMSVMPDYQEIAKLLDIPLGKDVPSHITPKIRELLHEKEMLLMRLNRYIEDRNTM